MLFPGPYSMAQDIRTGWEQGLRILDPSLRLVTDRLESFSDLGTVAAVAGVTNPFFNKPPDITLAPQPQGRQDHGKTGLHSAMAEPAPRPTVSPGFTLLVSLSTLLVFVVVVLSAYIRLSDAGLGCADWPACFGQIGVYDNRSLAEGGPLLPPSAARTFHRVAATLFGFFVLGIVYLAIRHRKRGGPGIVLPLIVLGLTVFLSVLGVVTPSPLIPAVTTGNVLGGMAMLALLWWIGLRIQPQAVPDSAAAARVKPWARLALVVVAAQIALGAWTSGSFAGPSCTQLSGCAGADFSVQNLARGFEPTRRLERDAQGKVMTDASSPVVHMSHRTGALLTFVYLTWLGLRARTAGGRLRSGGNVLLAILTLQVVLGLAGVATGLPLLLVTAHNAGAALLLLAVVNLNQSPLRQ
jgi:heme a synthase